MDKFYKVTFYTNNYGILKKHCLIMCVPNILSIYKRINDMYDGDFNVKLIEEIKI